MATIKSITYYCDPDTLGEIDVEDFQSEFTKLMAAAYPDTRVKFGDCPEATQIESTDDDFDPIDEYERIDGIAEKAFAAACAGESK